MMNGKKCPVGCVAQILLIVGGLNWGIVGLGTLLSKDWNVVMSILGKWPTLEAVVYVLVGLSALVGLMGMNGCCMGKCSTER